VFDELKDSIVDLAKSKYGRFLVKKMLTYGTKEQKDMIIKSFIGKVPKLIKHSVSSKVQNFLGVILV
jgi:pumilio family protein 6